MSQPPSDKSIYKQIALDIAQGIVAGRYPPGVKLRGRSTLAGQYNVSPETIRRATALLEKSEVLEVVPGAGIFIKSEKQAQEFVNRFNDQVEIKLYIASMPVLTSLSTYPGSASRASIASCLEKLIFRAPFCIRAL